MRHNDVIQLISVETKHDESGNPVYDEIGNPVKVETDRTVYANQFEVSSSEFYEASAQGLKPEKQFEVYSFEYRGEEKLRHEKREYRIIRTSSRGEKTRLVCERVLADG